MKKVKAVNAAAEVIAADRQPPKVISDSPEPGGAAGSHLVTERLCHSKALPLRSSGSTHLW